jgi:hypothetical protein
MRGTFNGWQQGIGNGEQAYSVEDSAGVATAAHPDQRRRSEHISNSLWFRSSQTRRRLLL